MGKETPTAGGNRDFSETSKGVLDATIATNLSAADDAQVNAYEMRHALLEARRKARVRYKNSETLCILPNKASPPPFLSGTAANDAA